LRTPLVDAKASTVWIAGSTAVAEAEEEKERERLRRSMIVGALELGPVA
jgi:hypothetical protein